MDKFDIKKVLSATPLKLTKKQVLAQARKCAGAPGFSDRAETEKLIGYCLRYFEPWPTKKASADNFTWVTLAANRNNAPLPNHPWTDDDYLWATDGKRLHSIPIGRLEPNTVYDRQHRVALRKIDDSVPQVSVFREKFYKKGEKYSVTRGDFVDVNEVGVELRYAPCPLADKRHINDVFCDPSVVVDVWVMGVQDVLFFQHSDRDAWIMPMRRG